MKNSMCQEILNLIGEVVWSGLIQDILKKSTWGPYPAHLAAYAQK
jgi:hypothetical protein